MSVQKCLFTFVPLTLGWECPLRIYLCQENWKGGALYLHSMAPDTDPKPISPRLLCPSEGSDWLLSSAGHGVGPRRRLAEVCPPPGPPQPHSTRLMPTSSFPVSTTQAPGLLHGGENFTLFGKQLFQLLGAPRGSSQHNTLRNMAPAHQWTSWRPQAGLGVGLCFSIRQPWVTGARAGGSTARRGF